ncbi:MAG TPA: hypothetical protein V6C88_21180 [Chroococcidiopsis sp.]
MKPAHAIALTALALLAACAPESEHAATLEAAYDKIVPEQAVVCREKQIEIRRFVLCENMLWLVEGDRYYAVNGSARPWVERFGYGFFEYQIPVDFDIKAITDQF